MWLRGLAVRFERGLGGKTGGSRRCSCPVKELRQYRPQPCRFLAIMTSVTASKTNWMLLVSVAQVMWAYTSLLVDLFLLWY